LIKAVIFDFDGLIIDTESPSYHAFRSVYQEYGVELPLSTYAKCVGTTFDHFNPYTYLSEQVGRHIEADLIKSKFNPIYAEMVSTITLRPGVEKYLEAAKERNLKIGLASSSPISWIRPYLTKYDLAGYFDSVCTADNVSKVKPDPELYLLALQNLGIAGNEAISFEDSLNGFTAAKAAGLHCVVVPNEITAHFDFQGCDLLIPSMDEMDLNEVIERISNKLRKDGNE